MGEIYEASKGKKDVTFWCYSPSERVPVREKKRLQTVNPKGMPPHKVSQYETHVDKMAEVETIEYNLQRSI